MEYRNKYLQLQKSYLIKFQSQYKISLNKTMKFKLSYPYCRLKDRTPDPVYNYNHTLVFRVYEFITIKNLRYRVYIKRYTDIITKERILDLSFECYLEDGDCNTYRTNSKESIRVYSTLYQITVQELKEDFPDVFRVDLLDNDVKKGRLQKKIISQGLSKEFFNIKFESYVVNENNSTVFFFKKCN